MARKKPQQNNGLTAGYVRKSPSGWPEGCVTLEQKKEYLDDLRRIRVAELTSDAERDGRTIDLWFDDMYISGRGEFLALRTGFDTLTVQAKSGQIGHVYARDLSRLFRDLMQQEAWFGEMEAADATVHIQDLPFIADQATRVLLRQQIGSINQYFATRQGQIIRATNEERVKSGAWVGRNRSMWGLSYNLETKRFDFDPLTADKARFVFEVFAECHGIGTRAAKDLNERYKAGHPRATLSPTGVLWGHTLVLQFVRMDLFRRRVAYGTVFMDAPEMIPEVIDPALVAEVDRLLASRTIGNYAFQEHWRQKAGRVDTTYGPVMRCGHCGSRMRAMNRGRKIVSRPWITWRCRANDGVKKCERGVGFSQARLDALLKEGIAQALREYAEANFGGMAGADNRQARQSAAVIDKDTLRAALDKVKAKQKRYYELLASGVIVEVADVQPELTALGEERRRLEAEISKDPQASSDTGAQVVRLTEAEWQRWQRQLETSWPDESVMEPFDANKHDLLQSMGIRIHAAAEPRRLDAAKEGKVVRFGGPLTIRVEVAALGRTGPLMLEIVETAEAFAVAERARFLRDKIIPDTQEAKA